MQTPVLTLNQQRKSLSSMKKKKKIISKNVLSLPHDIAMKNPTVLYEQALAINQIIANLLPGAGVKKMEEMDDKKKNLDRTSQTLRQYGQKRSQLLLGVNAVARGLRKELISAVLFADDIKPSHLVRHLNLLSMQMNVPYLHIPGLRETAFNTMGFPCIAIGFKKDSIDFTEVIQKIKTIYQNGESLREKLNMSNQMKEAETNLKEGDEVMKSAFQKSPSFVYHFRTSHSERAFIPEKVKLKPTVECNEETDFISVPEVDVEMKTKKPETGISYHLKKKKINSNNIPGVAELDDTEEVAKKKVKTDWVIDKHGQKSHFKYGNTRLIKLHSNPHRKTKQPSKKQMRK